MTAHRTRAIAASRTSALSRRLTASAAALALLAMAGPCLAGTQLLSRRSFIRAAAGAGPDAFELVSESTTFDSFADDVRDQSDDDASGAHQYSSAGLDDAGLRGAFAEGSAKARPDAPGGPAHAQSDFDLLFKVTDEPASFTFGAVIGSEGEASAMVRLANLDDPKRDAVFIAWVDALSPEAHGAGGTIERAGTLEPGTYALTVHADSGGAVNPSTSEDGSCYYNVNLALSANAVPLPPAVFPGLLGLGGIAVSRWVKRNRRC